MDDLAPTAAMWFRLAPRNENVAAYPEAILDLMKPGGARLTGGEIRRRLELELRPLILEWDPFGVGPGCPPDEYDCCFGAVLSALRAHPTEDELTEWVSAFGEHAPGADPQDRASRRTAGALLRWWDEAQGWLPGGIADDQ